MSMGFEQYSYKGHYVLQLQKTAGQFLKGRKPRKFKEIFCFILF